MQIVLFCIFAASYMPGKSQIINSIFSVDIVTFGFDESGLNVLLIERGEEPFLNYQAIPGDLAGSNENIDQAANRVLTELTGIPNIYLEQFYTFGNLNRHPWGRIITVAYFSLIKKNEFKLSAAGWATKAEWYPIHALPQLAFDHEQIIHEAFNRLKTQVKYQPIGFELLPRKFTLSQLQNLYEIILNKKLDKRNFRRKILKLDLLMNLNEKQKGVAHRAAQLFQFDKKKYRELESKGYLFEL